MKKNRAIRKIDKTWKTDIIANIWKIRNIVNKVKEGIYEKQGF